MEAVEIDDLWFSYTKDENYALMDINLKISHGDYLAIIGNNGSGKSTLLKLILGLLKPTRGRVLIDGLDTRRAKVSELARKIGLVFQNPNDQLFSTSVRSEIEFGLKNIGLEKEEMERRVQEVLEKFDLLEVQDVPPRFLSRGERQKVALASVVAMDPKIMLWDEPTTGQDTIDSYMVLSYSKKLNEEGKTMILVTHQIAHVAEFAKNVVVLNDGRIVKAGETHEVLSDVGLLKRCNLLPPRVTLLAKELKDLLGFDRIVTVEEFVELMRKKVR